MNSPHTIWNALTNLHSYSLWRQSKAGWQVLSVAESCCSHCFHRGTTAAIQTYYVSTASQERQSAKHLDFATVLKPSINSLDSRGVKRWVRLRRKALHQGLCQAFLAKTCADQRHGRGQCGLLTKNFPCTDAQPNHTAATVKAGAGVDD